MRMERNEKELEKIKTAIIAEALGIGTQSSQYIPGVGHIHIQIDPISVHITEEAIGRDDEYRMIGNFYRAGYAQIAIEVIYDLFEAYRNNPGAKSYEVEFSLSSDHIRSVKSFRFEIAN